MEKRPPLKPHTLPRTLGDYAQTDCARFHMPGHKSRGLGGFFREELAGWDVTELSMTDDLHHPESILRETAEQYRALYGAERSYLCVDGSTTALQAMILSLPAGEKLLLCRDCHKSVIAGTALAGLDTAFVQPKYDAAQGLCGQLTPERAEAALKDSGATALLVTSPNMYGFCADVPALAKAAHRHGALLLVDAAHGAHFPFSDALPRPMAGFADIWCHSQHKTMNAMTQTATLHLGKCRIAPETVQRQLDLIETSSPSYVLLASLDWALYTARRQDWTGQAARCHALRGVIGGMAGLSALYLPELPGVVEYDPTRLVIDVSERGITGFAAQRCLEEAGIYLEMADARRLVLITTPEDDPAWYPRLLDALQRLPYRKERPAPPEVVCPTAPARCMTLRDAVRADAELCPLEQSAGRVMNAPVGLYPPGIAAVLPGERMEQTTLAALLRARTAGAGLFGVLDGCVGAVKEGS